MPEAVEGRARAGDWALGTEGKIRGPLRENRRTRLGSAPSIGKYGQVVRYDRHEVRKGGILQGYAGGRFSAVFPPRASGLATYAPGGIKGPPRGSLDVKRGKGGGYWGRRRSGRKSGKSVVDETPGMGLGGWQGCCG